MKRLAFAAALIIAVTGLLIADDLADFQPHMKKGAAAVGALAKALDAGDADGAEDSAEDVAEHFEAMADFWDGKGVADANGMATDIVDKANEIHGLAESGDFDAAKAQLGELRGNCKSCHAAHREKAADGSWTIK